MINKEGYSSPDLIIQDEMHLISGPLGSVAGMYEIFINALTGKTIKDKRFEIVHASFKDLKDILKKKIFKNPMEFLWI